MVACQELPQSLTVLVPLELKYYFFCACVVFFFKKRNFICKTIEIPFQAFVIRNTGNVHNDLSIIKARRLSLNYKVVLEVSQGDLTGCLDLKTKRQGLALIIQE